MCSVLVSCEYVYVCQYIYIDTHINAYIYTCICIYTRVFVAFHLRPKQKIAGCETNKQWAFLTFRMIGVEAPEALRRNL